MVTLPTAHPEIARKFEAGNITIQKTSRQFSAIPIDQVHERNNAAIKGDGGAVGLTDNPTALRRRMMAGPEIARLIGEFEDEPDFIYYVYRTQSTKYKKYTHKTYIRHQEVQIKINSMSNIRMRETRYRKISKLSEKQF